MSPGLNAPRRRFQAGGPGTGVSGLPARPSLRLTEQEIRRMLRIVRNNRGEFKKKDICDYFQIWSSATNSFLLACSPGVFCPTGRPKSVRISQKAKISESRESEGSSLVPRVSFVARRITPTGQVVPRLSEFTDVADVVLCWWTGVVKGKSGRPQRHVSPLYLLMTATGRRKAFCNESSVYTNAWWRECHKSAYDRVRRVVECVSSFSSSLDILTQGNDGVWAAAIEKFHLQHGRLLLSRIHTLA